MSRRRLMMRRAVVYPVLPTKYQQVAWIGYNTTIDRYIILPIRAYEADIVEIELAKLTVPQTGTIAITTTSAGSGNWALLETNTDNKWTPDPTTPKAETFNYKKVIFTRNDTATSTSYLCIGYRDNRYTPELHFISYKIKTGASIVYNGIPCYRKADGIIGMYDTISGSFSGSADKNFLKGANVQ